MRAAVHVRRDRIRMRYSPKHKGWELVLLGRGDEETVVLARFFTGRKTDPGDLAQWCFERACVAEKV
jgi:hypothetical protein